MTIVNNQTDKVNQKYIYIVLSSSSSLPAKLIKACSGNKLNHSSISLNTDLHTMYSFGRIKSNNAFYAGLVKEDKDKGFYLKFTDTYIKLYRLSVSEDVFYKVKAYLEDAYKNRNQFKYNYLGVIVLPLNLPIIRKNQYFCSQFVATVLKENKVRKIRRDIHLFQPCFFEELEDIELIYEGLLSEYKEELIKIPRIKLINKKSAV